jgi:hypothetical protein
MPRTADYTIQGFLYQFNKTLLEILKASEDSSVTVEGVEDIDIDTPSGTKVIQCKYHEAQQSFSLSLLYKPLLLMMVHFHNNTAANVEYVLYGYFPNETPGNKYLLDKEKLGKIISTENKDYKKYVSLLKDGFEFKKEDFLSAVSIEFAMPIESLIKEVQSALVRAGISTDDVELIAYPNAINEIANISCRHDATERVIRKADLIAKLKGIKTTAISRWTLVLKTRKKLLTERKKQLKSHLDINARDRYFIISQPSLEDFDSSIVLFIGDYLNKYHFKHAHIKTPLFCLDCPDEVFSDIRYRLHQKGILVEDGMIGTVFDEQRFFRDPMTRKLSQQDMEREFHVRLIRYANYFAVVNRKKGDDLFIISNKDYENLDILDICVERLNVSQLKEASFLIGVSHDCE